MQLPLQVTFRYMEPSAAIEAKVRERADELDRFYDRIMSCRVVVEAPHRRHRQGKLYHVRVDLTVPGGELAVTRAPGQHHAHEDVYVTIRDAFDAARRRLEDYSRRQRGSIKAHTAPPRGQVSQLFASDGHGFITAADGTEIYFHRNSVLRDAFDSLRVGVEVEFTAEQGEKGPQASTVRLVRKSRSRR